MFFFAVAVICAYFVKGLCGFANTLVLGSILSFGVDNVDISPVDLLLGFPSNAILVWKNRGELRWRLWVPVTVLVLLGDIPGIFLLKNVDATVIKLLFGAVVTGLGLEMLWQECRRKAPAGEPAERHEGSKLLMLSIGLLSGVLCGLYGVGALLAVYMSRATDSDRAFKANMCAVFITENTFRVIAYSLTGILTLPVLRQAVFLVPAMLLGLWLGMRSAGRLDEAAVKKLVTLALVLSGVALIVTNLP